MNRLPPTGKLPKWNVGGLPLVPVIDDPRDTSMDSPDRIAERTPVLAGCDDVEYTVTVRPEITMKIRSSDPEAARWAAMHVSLTANADGVNGYVAHSVSLAIEVEVADAAG